MEGKKGINKTVLDQQHAAFLEYILGLEMYNRRTVVHSGPFFDLLFHVFTVYINIMKHVA